MRKVVLSRKRRQAAYEAVKKARLNGTISERNSRNSRARFAKMTKEERSEHGRRLVMHRYAKKAKAEGREVIDDDLVT